MRTIVLLGEKNGELGQVSGALQAHIATMDDVRMMADLSIVQQSLHWASVVAMAGMLQADALPHLLEHTGILSGMGDLVLLVHVLPVAPTAHDVAVATVVRAMMGLTHNLFACSVDADNPDNCADVIIEWLNRYSVELSSRKR